jgi:hypothetical protein
MMACQNTVSCIRLIAGMVLIPLSGAVAVSVSPTPAGASQPKPDSAGIVWLCRPGQAPDPCTASLKTTVITGDGKRHIITYKPAANPPVDCFYLYPNVSAQHTADANLDINPQETAIAELEASPFSQDCRVYAPMYREDTGLDPTSHPAQEVAEHSVMSAWNDYLAHYNDGRGIVLIGHSEGSGEITLLIDRIDQIPAVRTLLVSAIITGLDLPVSKAGLGPFATIGPCESETQTGCVIDFNAFSEPPPSNTMFGKVEPMVVIDGQEAESLCTNPSNLGGGSGTLISMYRTQLPTQEVPGSSTEGVLMRHPPVVSTPWVEFDGQYTGACVTSNGAHVLMVKGETGAPALTAFPNARWGLHVDDPNVAMGNLVSLVNSEIESYVATHEPTSTAAQDQQA